ncbi:MAG: ABC transporter substrate-binding protein [Nitriliruptorales bacterium]|nr:ABC transporter substrate-binding protein [Nitriliruptorales bacterium]
MFSVPGSKHQDGYEFCVDLINEAGGLLGRPVELVITDNRSDTETGVSQYERLINAENVDLLFGTFSSLLTFPTSAVAEQAGMLYPVPSGGALQIWARGFENIFYFQQQPAEFLGESAMEAFSHYSDEDVVSEGDLPQTASVVYAEDFFAAAFAAGLLGGQVAVEGTEEVVDLSPGFLAEAGIEVVMDEQWPEGYSDWLSLANSIRAADADLLAVGTASPDEAVEVVRSLQTVGYQPQAVYMSQGTQSEFQENLGEAANGVLAYSSWHPAAQYEGTLAGEPFSNQDFIEQFTAAYDRAPDEDEAIPFAVCQGMEQAVAGAGTTDNAAIRDWLRSRTEEDPVETVLGPYYWDERGLPIDRFPILTQWQDGALEFVYPVDEFPGVADLAHPKPEW